MLRFEFTLSIHEFSLPAMPAGKNRAKNDQSSECGPPNYETIKQWSGRNEKERLL
jgi:hypothetical protein